MRGHARLCFLRQCCPPLPHLGGRLAQDRGRCGVGAPAAAAELAPQVVGGGALAAVPAVVRRGRLRRARALVGGNGCGGAAARRARERAPVASAAARRRALALLSGSCATAAGRPACSLAKPPAPAPHRPQGPRHPTATARGAADEPAPAAPGAPVRVPIAAARSAAAALRSFTVRACAAMEAALLAFSRKAATLASPLLGCKRVWGAKRGRGCGEGMTRAPGAARGSWGGGDASREEQAAAPRGGRGAAGPGRRVGCVGGVLAAHSRRER